MLFHLQVLHNGQPHLRTSPDIFEIFAAKNPSNLHCSTNNSLNLNSDPFLCSTQYLCHSTSAHQRAEYPELFSLLTEHKKCHDLVNEKINLRIKLKSDLNIDETFNYLTTLKQRPYGLLHYPTNPIIPTKVATFTQICYSLKEFNVLLFENEEKELGTITHVLHPTNTPIINWQIS